MPTTRFAGLLLVLLFGTTSFAQQKQKDVWTDPNDETLPPEFALQGEYVGRSENGDPFGAQVIALGKSSLQAVVYTGGLPGAGWDGEHRLLMDGTFADGTVVFGPPTEPKKYMDGNPSKFSATQEFPPNGQEKCTGLIAKGTFVVESAAGTKIEMKRTERKSPTLGAEPPKGAVVLFDGSNLDHWNGGRLADGILHTDAKDVKSKDKFAGYTIHAEFLLPFCPTKRSQGRGNSGFYHTNGWEVQVLDSFGLDGLKNECGALYGRKAPDVNMCLPPLQWQTYDVDLVPSEDDPKKGTMTVRHNGVVIHESVECPIKQGGFTLQGHGNLLQYRNIWLVER